MSERTSELEKKFLAYLLSNKSYIAKSIARMHKQYFETIGKIYQMVIGYYNKYHGIITDDMIDIKCKQMNTDENTFIQIKTIINECRNDFIDETEGEFEAIEDAIIGQYERRRLLKVASKIVGGSIPDSSDEQFQEVFSNVQKLLVDIESTDFDVEKEGTVEEDADERLKDYMHIKEHPEDINLIKTGFKHIDDAIVGWGFGSENIVCGRKGDGKSTMLLNLGYYLWKQGKNILFYSLEIDKKQYERRWASLGCKSGTCF